MNSPRPTRNIQQVRSIIQNMGRSIDEARNRRLGPNEADIATPARIASIGDAPYAGSGAAAAGTTPSAASATAVAPRAIPAASATRPAADARKSAESVAPPPVRSAQEMFAGDAPRLKARPKRAD